MLRIIVMLDAGKALLASLIIVLYETSVLTVLLPILARSIPQSYHFVLPGILLQFEIGQSFLFLRTPIGTAQYWIVLVFQIVSAISRNTGLMAQLVNRLRTHARMPPKTDAKLRREREELAVMAMSSTFGELVAPLYLLLALGVEHMPAALYSQLLLRGVC